MRTDVIVPISLMTMAIACMAPSLQAQETDTGRLAAQVCASCHGPRGDSISAAFPKIAGQRAESRTVWTIGRMLLDPNAPSIVPGRAEMQVQFRDTDTDILALFERSLLELVHQADRAGPCRIEIAPLSKSEPAAMDPRFQAAIEAAAERHAPGLHLRMPSGAGHDAQILSRRLRSAMMFVPSLKGISHHWAEDTKEEDIVLGAQVFADAAAAILRAE